MTLAVSKTIEPQSKEKANGVTQLVAAYTIACRCIIKKPTCLLGFLGYCKAGAVAELAMEPSKPGDVDECMEHAQERETHTHALKKS